MKKTKYNYRQFYVGLKPEEGKELEELLKDRGIGFSEFVRNSIEKLKKQNVDNQREETILEKQEMQEYINNYDKLETALNTTGEEKMIANLLRIKKRYIDKLKDTK